MRLIQGLVVLALAFGPAQAERAAALGWATEETYDLYVGGFRAGEMTVSVDVSSGAYEVAAMFRTVGIVGFFTDQEIYAKVVGQTDGENFQPLRYISNETEDGERSLVEVEFHLEGPSKVSATPALRRKPWSIDPVEQTGTLDPLSAILLTFLPRDAKKACNSQIEAFDGRHRFAFRIGPLRTQGERLLCAGEYVRVAGYKPKTLKNRPSEGFTMELEPRDDGTFRVTRLVSDGTYGAVVIKLR